MKIRQAILCMFIMATSVRAQVGPTTIVTVQGEAAIIGGDLPAAREEALVDAQRNALEQVLGAKIRAESAVQNFALADDAVLAMVSGYIRSSKIISEKQQDGLLRLEVQCEVARELTDEEADHLVQYFSCVVRITTEIDSHQVNDNRLAQTLSAALVQAGFDVRDVSELAALSETDVGRDRPETAVARWLGRQMLSNVVILGKAQLTQVAKKQVTGFAGTVGVYAYECRLEAKAIETESGQVIAQHSAPIKGILGTGDAPQKAVSDALSRAQNEFVTDLVAQLTAYGGRKSRPVTIEVKGIPTLEEFQKVKQLLNNVRFRDSLVSDLGFQADQTSTFRFDYSENINLIALKLEHTPGIAVEQKTGNRVVCRYGVKE